MNEMKKQMQNLINQMMDLTSTEEWDAVFETKSTNKLAEKICELQGELDAAEERQMYYYDVVAVIDEKVVTIGRDLKTHEEATKVERAFKRFCMQTNTNYHTEIWENLINNEE